MTDNKHKSKKQLAFTLLSSLFADFGSSIFAFGMSFMLLEKTASVYSFALSAIISPIVGLLLLPIVGPMVDRFSKKKIILYSQAAAISGLIIYWLAFPYVQQQILLVSILLILVLKISDQFTSTARQAASIQLVLETELNQLSAFSQISTSIAGVVSAVFGVFLYSIMPFYLFIFLELLTEILAMLFTFLLDFNFQKTSQKMETTGSQLFLFTEGLHFIKKQNYLLLGMVLALSINFFLSIFSVGLPALILQTLALSNVHFGFAEAFNGLGVLIGGLLIKHQKKDVSPFENLFSGCLKTGSIIFLIGLIPFIQNKLLATGCIYFALFLTGYLIVSLNVPYIVWLQKNLPIALQGRVFSVLSTLGMAISPLAVLLFGYLFELQFLSITTLTVIIFTATGLLAILFTLAVVKRANLPLKEAKIILSDNKKNRGSLK